MSEDGLPFTGLKVADFSWVGVGPITSRHLADFGATVVRVETSTRPDTLRLAPPFRDGKAGLDRSAFGAAYNTNKFGLALNLRLPRARELALDLVRWADIVTDSMTPGSMARLGLSYEDLRRVKPDIIMYSTTQQGQTGPLREFGGYGSHGAATAGLHAITGWPDRPPAGIFGAYTDFVSPWFLYTALVAALDYRDRTGEGQYLDQAQVEAGAQILGPQLLDYFATGHALTREGNADAQLFPHGVYRCAAEATSDDRWLALAVRDAADWQALCGVLGRTEWASDPALESAAQRRERGDEIEATIAAWARVHEPRAAMAELQAVGVPAGAVNTCEDLFSDPQLAERGHWWQLDHREIGVHAYDAPAWRLSETPALPRRPGPALGQHSAEVCRDILGLDDETIAELGAAGVFE